jgi:hypothetical protein
MPSSQRQGCKAQLNRTLETTAKCEELESSKHQPIFEFSGKPFKRSDFEAQAGKLPSSSASSDRFDPC